MNVWSDDGRTRRDSGERREQRQRPSGRPSLGSWYAKGLATAVPPLVAGGISLFSTGSGAVATVVAAAVTAATGPAVESWFKGREIKAEEEAASAATSAEFGSDGAMGRTLITIGTVYELIDDIRGRAEACGRQLGDARSRLAAVMGGGGAVPQNLMETYGLNGEAQADLKQVVSATGQASVALRRFQASIS